MATAEKPVIASYRDRMDKAVAVLKGEGVFTTIA